MEHKKCIIHVEGRGGGEMVIYGAMRKGAKSPTTSARLRELVGRAGIDNLSLSF